MRNRHEAVGFSSREWTCVKVHSPQGDILLARRLPTARPSGAVSDWISRRFAPGNLPGLAIRRVRSRRPV